MRAIKKVAEEATSEEKTEISKPYFAPPQRTPAKIVIGEHGMKNIAINV
jgi:hypothetical protein